MITNFNFKNYASFSDECNFTMLANKDSAHEMNLIPNERVSKVKIIYGANASGKTSFIDALNFMCNFMSNSNTLMEGMKIKVRPFKFRKNCFEVPSKFSITFIKDSIKYLYSFSCTREKVIDEKLDIYYSSKPTNIFERKNTTDYKFTRDLRVLNDYKNKTTANKLFLATSANWGYEKTKPVADYLINNIDFSYNRDNVWNTILDEIRENGEMEEYKRFCLNILSNADLSISDFSVETHKVKDDEKEFDTISPLLKMLSNGDEDLFNACINLDIYNFKTEHIVNNNEHYMLNLNEESLGTCQIFNLAPLLYDVLKKGKVLVIDEIDRSLHPLIVEYLVKMFQNPDTNPNNAQLIANTHDTNLLNLEIFRRDEIWFTERNSESGATELYALSDFSPRTNENIEKAYLLGRFGAIPFIKGV